LGKGQTVLNASGYVTARRQATVSSKVTAKVLEVLIEEGMAVKEGQILARIDDAAYRAAYALAQANLASQEKVAKEDEVRLANAKLTLERKQKLVDGGFAMKSEVDDAKMAVDALEARLELEKQNTVVSRRQMDLEQTNLDNTIIRAPFSGIAISKDAQPGEMVSPVSAGGGFTRTGICTIVDMRSLEIEVDVNESYINRVRPGQNVSAILDAYADWTIPAHVITVVPTADRQKATVLVRIGFDALDPRILPDMGVKVTFLKDEQSKDDPKNPSPAVASTQPTVLVPKAAIVNRDGQDIVFVVKNDHAERVAIKVGGNDADRMEVLAGLSAGDRVVVSPPPAMTSGSLVTVKK
jgi:RND family efflux transporter MFP subunit